MDQLLLAYNDISRWVDKGSVVDLVLFDFSKAFDVVSHPVLLTKLHLLGIDLQLISWIEHFLINCSMSVSVKGTLSTPRAVGSGVPQGSVLGPLLFLIFVNHIAVNLSCCYKIFADDLKIYMRIRYASVANYTFDVNLCQTDIITLQHTASSWGLNLNHDKCTVLRFRRKSHVIPPPCYCINGAVIRVVHSHPDLGLLVDCDLKFHLHVTSTVQKAAALAQNLIKSTVCRTPEFMISLFRSHIRPILE